MPEDRADPRYAIVAKSDTNRHMMPACSEKIWVIAARSGLVGIGDRGRQPQHCL
jgi:hypothetical protein